MKQHEQIIRVMRQQGGYATLGFLNQHVDVSTWKTKTPYATIRRIVQDEKHFFKIKSGLWAIKELKDKVLCELQIQDSKNQESQDKFNHTYFQGLLVEMGCLEGYSAYIPPQDKNKKFLGKALGEISSITTIPFFSYPEIIGRAKSVDVIWFNDRKMPNTFFEIEHTTDIQNSLLKFYELQDFHSRFFIVGAIERKREFEGKIGYSAFKDIKDRVKFVDYDYVVNWHTKSFELASLGSI